MTDNNPIKTAQQYLTYTDDNGVTQRRIIDIEHLSATHDPGEIILFLLRLYRDKRHRLAKLIMYDTVTPEIDRLISSLFRIHMALSVLNDFNRKEGMDDSSKPRAA